MQMKRTGYIILVVLIAFCVNKFLFKNHTQNPYPDTVSARQDNNTANNATPGIAQLTSENVVAPYVKQHHHLPDCYITKSEARKLGWNPSQGNICDVLPGRAIGGDVFSNREHSLPDAPGRKWFEADIDFDCGRRNADRLLFSSDGLVYVTKDHYRTFQQQ